MDNIYSAYHYACKTKADKEAIEQIYEEVKKSAQNATNRNIGDIFFTARTDTEINGAVECNGGTYSTVDFEGKQNVGNLLANGSLPYVSLSEYESLVSANGSCRAFGWDGGAEFRVPLLNDVYIEAGTALSAGEFINESLPDHKHTISHYSHKNSGPKSWFHGDENGNEVVTIDTNYASASNPVYQDGAKVKPDSVRYRAMVQLANGATDQAVITATSALQQIANKVDKTSATDRETVVGWGMPDYSAEIAITSPYTAPRAGIVTIGIAGNPSGADELKVLVNDKEIVFVGGRSNVSPRQVVVLSVDKNDVISWVIKNSNEADCKFYPFKGAN